MEFGMSVDRVNEAGRALVGALMGPYATAQLQAQHLARCAEKIAPVIERFCAARLRADAPEFTMGELVEAVTRYVPNCAPDSPSRVLRDLRKRGRVRVALVSRGQSRYRVEAVRR